MYRVTRQTTASYGFTLVEVILVIIIMGILATVALRSISQVGDAARTEETKQELDELAAAIVGSPVLDNAGIRNDFGYVGDIGALPPNLDALMSNPGGYATWNGPYVGNRFAQDAVDYKTDAFGAAYTYTGGVDIISTGSGEPIVRRIAGTTADLLANEVAGAVLDAKKTPPGTDFQDSIEVLLTVPDGSGGLTVRTATPGIGGYFAFNAVPTGNHDLDIIYTPTADTLHRFVSVVPGSEIYQEHYLTPSFTGGAGGGGTGLDFVANSDTLGGTHCNELVFWVANNGSAAVSIDWIRLTWTTPEAYYQIVRWDGSAAYNGATIGSGDMAGFSTTRTVAPGAAVPVVIDEFREHFGAGGPKVDVTGTTFTVELSDGTTFTIIADNCP